MLVQHRSHGYLNPISYPFHSSKGQQSQMGHWLMPQVTIRYSITFSDNPLQYDRSKFLIFLSTTISNYFFFPFPPSLPPNPSLPPMPIYSKAPTPNPHLSLPTYHCDSPASLSWHALADSSSIFYHQLSRASPRGSFSLYHLLLHISYPARPNPGPRQYNICNPPLSEHSFSFSHSPPLPTTPIIACFCTMLHPLHCSDETFLRDSPNTLLTTI
jgi:hypothetical protein